MQAGSSGLRCKLHTVVVVVGMYVDAQMTRKQHELAGWTCRETAFKRGNECRWRRKSWQATLERYDAPRSGRRRWRM